jgi:hypothetical protein
VDACSTLTHPAAELNSDQLHTANDGLQVVLRWTSAKQKPFSERGRRTDGKRTPGAEWYYADTLLAQFAPYRLRPLTN